MMVCPRPFPTYPKMILLTDIFRLHCKTVLQTDFFVINSDAQTIYSVLHRTACATFLKTKGKRYEDISIVTATGVGSPAVPWRANTGEGWEGKMKLRFVKFFTSRENEIEKKEGGGRD